MRVLGTLFACAFLGSASLCHAHLKCVTTSTSYQAPAGCNVNQDGVPKHIDKCTVTIYTKTCTSGSGATYVTRWLTAGIVAPSGGVKNERFGNLEASPGWLFKPADGIAFVQAGTEVRVPPQAPPSTNARFRVPVAAGIDSTQASPPVATSATDGRSSPAKPVPALRTLKCENGFATVYDAAGAALEPVAPCFGGEWAASTR
jgi:hypothetical protein